MHIDMPIAEILCRSCLIDLSGSACLGGCNTADTQTWENPLIPRLLILVLGRTGPEQLVSEQRRFQLSRTPSQNLCFVAQNSKSHLLCADVLAGPWDLAGLLPQLSVQGSLEASLPRVPSQGRPTGGGNGAVAQH